MVEGINDFLRVDFAAPLPLPYRRCDYVFLAGEDDAQYFEDRSTFLVGLPNVEALASIRPEFPREMLAVLNVNFTYGALEDRRDEFVRAAQEAFDKLGIAWQITHHPMDKGDLSGLPVSPSTQQQLIDRCSVFVSRFATGIIEALASGKPVIYFNPHGEEVAKFSDPLGAFEIARSATELADALRRVETDIAAGVDFRARAAPFLRRHAGLAMPDGSDVSTRFSAAVIAVLDAHGSSLAAGSELFLNRLEELDPFRQERPGLVLGDFSRSHGAQMNEEEMIGRCFGPGRGLMVDVGANFGNSLDVYLGKGWTVHAFEPDPNNRAKLELLWPNCERLVINPQAVSDRDGLVVPLYASDESTGISSLSAFTDGHRQVAEVSTVTLTTYMESAKIEHVDFLKVDVEGFDKFVLDGFPWERDRPEAVLVEFEDSKTVPLGYAVGDLVEVLRAQGYTVYVSEWHPIVRYGIAHDWKSLSRHDPDVDLSGTWGNLVAFRADPGEEVLSRAAAESLRFVVRKADPSATGGGDRADQPGRATAGRDVRSTRLSGARARMARLGSFMLRAARQHLIATSSLAAAIAAAMLLPIVADEPDWRPWSWAIALLLIGAAGGLAFAAVVREALRRSSRRQDQESARLRRDLQRRLDVRTARASQRTDAVAGELRRLRSETERDVDQLNHQVQALRVALKESAEMVTRSSEQVAAMQADAADERRRSNYSNVAGFAVHDRHFSGEDAAHVHSYWQSKFGLSMPTRQLMYLAHDICRAEDQCEGRLATTVQAAVVRSLALMGLTTRNVEVLEVGTLFGIGAGALYRAGARVGKRVRLTLLDPLNSYHDAGFRDPTTGVPVTLEVVKRNLNAMAVAEPDVRIVLGKRGDDEVVAELSDREYDYVLIDGEKTLRGVAADVARYGRHVRPGGVLVFDFDTTEWSHNEAFIEGHILGNGDWTCVGVGWRTIVLTRSPSPVGARVLGASDRSSTIDGE
jgi:FkbM family methyltransferase